MVRRNKAEHLGASWTSNPALLARCGRCRFNTRAADTLTRNQIGFALEDTSSSGDALRGGILGTRCLALEEQKTMIIERLKSGVITVGHGCGFVVEGAGERLVITAAHCLPSLPPALPSFGLKARTYGPLLARRGEEPRAWAVCRFVDPLADIAVLGSPDNPHTDDYKALIGTATALSFGDPVRHPVNFWAPPRLLSLDGRWFSSPIRP